jgi:hypothetical protein
MFSALVVNNPNISWFLFWFYCNNVLPVRYFFALNVQSIASESVLHLFRTNIVSKPLVVKTSPVKDNHILIKAFKKSTTFLTNGLQALFFSVPKPLLIFVWVLFSAPFFKVNIMNTCYSWSI